MRTHIAMLGMLAILEIAVAEENYSQWSKYRPISINTTSSGANVAGTVSNFPVLVRLTSAYADVFTQTLSGGADIRFTDSTGTVRLPHQKERWDTAAQVAEFWVLVPSIAGNASTGIRLYWGKSGVADSSNGSRVFSTGNDFRAVWHLNEPSGDISDVTDNAFAGINNGTVSAASQIGMGRSFNGTTSNYIRIDKSGRDDGGANTNNAKASLLDSLLTTFTVSTWFNATSWGSTVSKLICRGSSTIKYAFQGTNPGLLFNQNATTSGPKTTSDPATGWHLVHGTYSGGTANFFMDGVLVASRTGGSRATDCSPYELMIGARNTSTAYPPTSVAEPFHGLLDEIRIQGAPRSTDWIKLDYETQKAGSTAVTLGATVVRVSGSPIIISGPANKTFVPGTTVKFGVVASGNATLVYKWVRRNVDTVGTNSDSLTLTNASAADTGTYKCVVSNSLGQAVTASATLTLAIAPNIVQHPTDWNMLNLGSYRFVVVATGSNPLTYKWVKNNVDTLSNTGVFSGATTDTLKFTNAQISDTGTFKCVVRNVAGQAVTNTAHLFSAEVGISRGFINGNFAIQNLGSSVKFHLPDGISSARVSVMDVWGRIVWNKTAGGGVHELVWDGKVNEGRPVTGIYFARMTTDDGKNSRILAESKITLVH